MSQVSLTNRNDPTAKMRETTGDSDTEVWYDSISDNDHASLCSLSDIDGGSADCDLPHSDLGVTIATPDGDNRNMVCLHQQLYHRYPMLLTMQGAPCLLLGTPSVSIQEASSRTIESQAVGRGTEDVRQIVRP